MARIVERLIGKRGYLRTTNYTKSCGLTAAKCEETRLAVAQTTKCGKSEYVY